MLGRAGDLGSRIKSLWSKKAASRVTQFMNEKEIRNETKKNCRVLTDMIQGKLTNQTERMQEQAANISRYNAPSRGITTEATWT